MALADWLFDTVAMCLTVCKQKLLLKTIQIVTGRMKTYFDCDWYDSLTWPWFNLENSIRWTLVHWDGCQQTIFLVIYRNQI